MDAAPVIRLSDLELFADCTRAKLRQMESLTTYLQVERDRVLIREGRGQGIHHHRQRQRPDLTGDG